jgi:hypothetical protein
MPSAAKVATRIVFQEVIMRYTTDRPTLEGFYWVRYWAAMADREYETVVWVYYNGAFRAVDPNRAHGANLSGPNAVFWDGENYSITDDQLRAFAGPIPRPEG